MYATQTHRTPKSLFNFQMTNSLKKQLARVADMRGMTMAQIVRTGVETIVAEWEPRLNSQSTLPSKVKTSNWNVSSPNVPVTDYTQPLAIFANSEPNNDW